MDKIIETPKHSKGTAFFSSLIIAVVLFSTGFVIRGGGEVKEHAPQPEDIVISMNDDFILDCTTFPGGEMVITIESKDTIQSYNCMAQPSSK